MTQIIKKLLVWRTFQFHIKSLKNQFTLYLLNCNNSITSKKTKNIIDVNLTISTSVLWLIWWSFFVESARYYDDRMCLTTFYKKTNTKNQANTRHTFFFEILFWNRRNKGHFIVLRIIQIIGTNAGQLRLYLKCAWTTHKEMLIFSKSEISGKNILLYH